MRRILVRRLFCEDQHVLIAGPHGSTTYCHVRQAERWRGRSLHSHLLLRRSRTILTEFRRLIGSRGSRRRTCWSRVCAAEPPYRVPAQTRRARRSIQTRQRTNAHLQGENDPTGQKPALANTHLMLWDERVNSSFHSVPEESDVTCNCSCSRQGALFSSPYLSMVDFGTNCI